MKEGRRKKRGRRSFEEKVENLRRASESIHSYPGHIFTLIHLRHILSVVAAILISLMAIGAFELYKNYAYYAAIVDKQLNQRLLQRKGGVYAAPRQVSVEQRISREELRERLLRAGYRQKGQETSDDQFSSGSFFFEGDEVKLRTKEFARSGGLPETVNIKFDGRQNERIVKIENTATGRDLKSASLPPELLTADGGAGMHSRSQAGFEEFPPSLVNALIAIEDRNFFQHGGVDVKAVLRALWENWSHGKIREGGSTITQQLIKTNLLTPERTYQRKFAEAMMAMALERRLSKEKIFTLYANRVYLGQSGFTAIYGFKQAARVFFGKDLHELSIAESALIAGLAQAPNRYSPYLRPEVAVARRNIVLDAMVETGGISEDEAEAAKSERLLVRPPASADESAAQHFVDYVKRELASRNIDLKDAPNLEIRTTLDLDLQEAANIAVKNYLSKLDRIFNRRPKAGKTKGQSSESALPEAALIAINPHNGEILAMVGGRDYASSQLNRVTDARRQPGSVFKPIVYATALANGVSPETIFIDSPHEIIFGQEVYSPRNYGGRFSNQPVTLREGIVRSLNVVAVDAAIMVGLRKVADLAEKMGLPRPEPYPSMALGAFEA
ncbi:MAG TPA: transglycosylase domain-containing protein, partial [Blastocatellia bacterium]|nr:transglycosylase domain-containing protein [Blastocatellia bacterium]